MSEIAESRARAKITVDEECGFTTSPEFGTGLRWQIENAVMRAERDTRERDAQEADDFLTDNGYGVLVQSVAERIRGKE